jgi:carboxylesterase
MLELKPFKDLSDVDDIELHDLDFKRAESENVALKANYPHFEKRGDIGILLVHGFTSSPLEMQPLADYLAMQGFSVYNVRLSGHASDYHYLNMTSYADWYDSVKYGLFTLKRNCKSVFVAGSSMGGLVSLMTAHLNGLNGAILLAPCIKIRAPFTFLTPYLSKIMPTMPKVGFDMQYSDIFYHTWPMKGVATLYEFTKYAETLTADFKIPLLGFQFPGDMIVSAAATKRFFSRVGSKDKLYVEFPNKDGQTHILTSHLNQHRDEMFANIAVWLNDRSGK